MQHKERPADWQYNLLFVAENTWSLLPIRENGLSYGCERDREFHSFTHWTLRPSLLSQRGDMKLTSRVRSRTRWMSNTNSYFLRVKILESGEDNIIINLINRRRQRFTSQGDAASAETPSVEECRLHLPRKVRYFFLSYFCTIFMKKISMQWITHVSRASCKGNSWQTQASS